MTKRKRIIKTLFVGPFAPPYTGDGVKNNFLKEGFEAAGINNITYFDTISRKGNKWVHLFKLLNLVRKHQQIIMSLNRKGRYAIIMLYCFFRLFSGKRAVLYVVGGTYDKQLAVMPTLLRRVYVWMINRLEGVFAESQTLKSGLESFGVQNVEIVYNPRKDSGEKWQLTEQKRGRIVFLSRVCETKGIVYLMDAVEKLAKQGSQLQLDVYGPIDEYLEEEFLQRVQESSGLIQYQGLIDPHEVQGVLIQYHFLALPTYHHGEGLPGILVEAGMAGIPILITRFNALPEYFVHQKSAFFVRPMDLDDLTNGLSDMLSSDSMLIDLSQGVNRVSLPFTLEKIMARSFQLFNEKGWHFKTNDDHFELLTMKK